MNRRGFIGISLGTLGLLVLGIMGRRAPLPDVQLLLNWLPAPADAAMIGRIYLRHSDRAVNAATLTTDLQQLAPQTFVGSDKRRREALARAVRGDFEEGRTEEVEGWVLSRTEAYVFALVALTRRD